MMKRGERHPDGAGEEKRSAVSSFFQHFSLRRKTVGNGSSRDKDKVPSTDQVPSPYWPQGSQSSGSPVSTRRGDFASSPSPSPSYETSAISSGSSSTSSYSIDGSAMGFENGPHHPPPKRMSRLQRASSMIRRGAGARKFKDDPPMDMFSSQNEDSAHEPQRRRGFLGKERDFSDGEGEEKSNSRRSLTLKSNHTFWGHKSSKDDGMFGRGEPGYFIKELKKNATTSSSTSKRTARGNRQLETLAELKEQLKVASPEWLQEFVREPFRGVQMLIEVFHDKQRKQQTGTELSIQASCLECLRILANTSVGLAQLMNTSATKKVASLLSSRDTQIKSAALELLSFVCLVPPKGVHLVLDAMNHYRIENREPARFQTLIHSLRTEEKSVSFLINGLFFINSLVNSPEELDMRLELRREFINLGLNDLIKSFKETWALSSSELKTQLKVFEEEMQHDMQEDKRIGQAKLGNVDKSNPEDLFSVVHRQVRDSPYYQSFCSSLANMLQLSSTNIGQQAWQAVEAMLSQYLSLADREGAAEVEVMLLQDLEELKHKHERKVRNLNNRVRRAQAENAELREQLEKMRLNIREEQNQKLKEDINRALSANLPASTEVEHRERGVASSPEIAVSVKEPTEKKTVTILPEKLSVKALESAAVPPPLAPVPVPAPAPAAPGAPPGPPPPMGGGGGHSDKLPPKKTVHPTVKLKHLNWTKIPAAMVRSRDASANCFTR